jgi:diaminopimelate epimerase
MAKKKIKDFEISVDTEKVDVKVKKKGDNVKVDVDTPKVDVNVTKEGEKYDSEKLDVHVKKDEAGTTVIVESDNSLLKKFGTWLSNIYVKRFNRKK